MILWHVVVLAVLGGFAEALPISGSAHGALARLWLDPGAGAAGLAALLQVGTAVALAAAARGRLLPALSEGVRAVARPTLFRASPGARDAAVLAVASGASLLTSALVLPRVELWSEAPFAVGLGLLVTGLGLLSTLAVRRVHGPPKPPRGPAAGTSNPGQARGPVPLGPPSLGAAILVGAAHGFAVFPGASRVGAALTVLLWLGVRPGRAVDLALLLTVPSLLVAAAQGLSGAGASIALEAGAAVMGLVLAFLGAAVAASALRRLVERRRLGALALWPRHARVRARPAPHLKLDR
jgi:undecaprenyl-diphosphatase